MNKFFGLRFTIATIIIFGLSEHALAQAPAWSWSTGMGGDGFETGNAVAVDAAGNVYTTGSFKGTVDFDPGPGTFYISAAANHSIFIMKQNAMGNLIWAKEIGGAQAILNSGNAIALDDSGNVYTTGVFGGLMDFDPGPGVYQLLATFFADVYVSKLDSAGNFVWAVGFGDQGDDMGHSIALDKQGNIYVTGEFRLTVDFDPGPGTFNLSETGLNPNGDIFVSKLDNLGNFIGAVSMGGYNKDVAYSMVLDSSSVYVAGFFSFTADFDPGAGVYNLTVAGTEDAFICKLDQSLNFVWARQAGGKQHDFAYSLAYDPSGSGSVYAVGTYIDTADFNPGAGIYNLISVPGTFNSIYVLKVDTAGNFIWAKSFGDHATGGNGSGGYNNVSVALNATDGVYVTGGFGGIIDFDPDSVATYNLTSIDTSSIDIFLTKLDSGGNFKWAKAAGGSGDDISRSVALNQFNNVFITGEFRSSIISFDSTQLTIADSTVFNSDIYVARLDSETVTGTFIVEYDNPEFILFPDPAVDYFTITCKDVVRNAELTLYNMKGKRIYNAQINYLKDLVVSTNDIDRGMYVVQIRGVDFISNQKVIIVK